MNAAKGASPVKTKIKSRLPLALVGGIVPTSMIFFFGPAEIFFGNRGEFLFRWSDFALWAALAGLAAACVIAALILFLPDTASRVVFGVTVWITAAGVVQSVFLNGDGGLLRDSGNAADTTLIIIDTALWAVLGILSIGASIIMKKKSGIKPILIIAMITVFAMLLASCATNAGGMIDDITSGGDTKVATETENIADTANWESLPPPETETDTETETEEERTLRTPLSYEEDRYRYEDAYLTFDGIDQVSKKNIVVFLIDRFDVNYYNSVLVGAPDLFDGLDGFTYFSDNVSLYSRTYPAVPTMLTGIDTNFEEGADKYLFEAYQNSPFLNDLKNDGYAVKIYTQNFYSYRGGTALYGIADNLSVAQGYEVTDRPALVGKMLMLSAYKWAPTLLKDSLSISSASFSGIVSLKGDGELYESNDPYVCAKIMDDGLTLDSNGKSFTFIHLSGCHSPYNMDENCNWTYEENTSVEQHLRGCMKMIYSYIDEMKRLGVYDDATIVITGDHPAALSDYNVPWQPRLTALFVKPAGSSGTPLKYSNAQVSQENFIPTLIKSAEVRTDNEYGKGYFDIAEGENTVRHHKFEICGEDNSDVSIVDLVVTGDGADFSNWSVDSTTYIGALYR